MSYPNKTNRSRSLIVARKEFREIFRDRRTLMSVIIGPLVITPALLAVIGIFIGGQVEKAKTQIYPVGIVGTDAAAHLLAKMQTALKRVAPNVRVTPISEGDAERQIKARRLDAVAVLPPDADRLLAQQKPIPVKILEDAGDETSQGAAARLSAIWEAMGKQLVVERLRALGQPPEFATPFVVTEQPIAQGGSVATLVLSRMLPYILILGAFGGSIYAAFDQVAGEKERGTLETLLVSPASRRDIVLGKFGAVVGVCLISSLLSVIGFMVPFFSGAKAFEWLSKGGAHLSLPAIGVTLLVLLPLSVLFAGVLLALSTFARNQKEAQTYLGSLFPLVLLPAMLSMFMGADAGLKLALVPILGASIIIKQALSDSYNAAFILIAFAGSVLWASLALFVATRLFQKESVLIKA
ncbi:MAG TPA: ABC transporter permease [Chthonomonadaceae bacterium]|nr:ABC transporter permease [Chthonomonadaceae bacterium]